MNHYAPATKHIAFHFEKYDDFIYTPVIRSEIRNLKPENLGHFTVYLPAYSDEFIINQVKKIKNSTWQIFSKHSKKNYVKENVEVFPVDNQLFQNSVKNCAGLLTGGGFEGPAEALFLGKKVLSVPMHHQYEQQCNALALEKMGIPVVWNQNEFSQKLQKWVEDDRIVAVNFPDETEQIIQHIFENYKNL